MLAAEFVLLVFLAQQDEKSSIYSDTGKGCGRILESDWTRWKRDYSYALVGNVTRASRQISLPEAT